MGLTPEAEEAQDRSMRKEQEERERDSGESFLDSHDSVILPCVRG